jgi:putative acetyltransferase
MTVSEIQIRPLEPEDVSAIAELLSQPRAVWGTMQLPFVSVDARRRRQQANPPGHTVLAAVIDGKVIGTAGLTPNDNRRRAHVGSIGMAVHDAYAGRGAGRTLLSALLDQADRWLALTRIELTVWVDNTRAIALYESCGFEREGLFRSYGFRDGVFVDALAMARLES